MQIGQLAEKTKTRGERFLLNAQKSWRDTLFPEIIFFFKRFPCTFENRCQKLTTVGWKISAQIRNKKKTNFSMIFLVENCTLDTQKLILPNPLRMDCQKAEKNYSMSKNVKIFFKKSLPSAERSFGRIQFSRLCRKKIDKNPKVIAQCLKIFFKKRIFLKALLLKMFLWTPTLQPWKLFNKKRWWKYQKTSVNVQKC